MNIVECINDRNLFGSFFKGDSWRNWQAAVGCLYGLEVPESQHDLIEDATDRPADDVTSREYREALFLIGRRGGKSRVTAAVGCYEALFGGHERRIASGETGLVAICAITRQQALIIKGYVSGLFRSTRLLRAQVAEETREGLKLKNGIEIRILTGTPQLVRGFTVVCAICDEICHFHLSELGKIRSADELVAALKPALLTTRGRLIAISSPHTPRGWPFHLWKRSWGVVGSPSLVWVSPTIEMNPTVPLSAIHQELDEDPGRARSEYVTDRRRPWREDVEIFVSRELVESLIAPGRLESVPREGVQYTAAVDVSGGRGDASVLSVGHRANGRIVQDLLNVVPAPHSPHAVCRRFAGDLQRYGVKTVQSDQYAGEFVTQAFRNEGIRVEPALTASQTYAEALPHLTSGMVVLVDNEQLITELSMLERRPRANGPDRIDHPTGAHDDVADATCKMIVAIGRPLRLAGSAWSGSNRVEMNPRQQFIDFLRQQTNVRITGGDF